MGDATFITIRYCDPRGGGARFRHIYRVYGASGREVGRRITRRVMPAGRECAHLPGVAVSTGTIQGYRFTVRVMNERTGRSALREVPRLRYT